jgi:hypothetical protein
MVPTLDTVLRVYDANGTLLATDDDSGDGRNSTVTVPVGLNELVFIEVTGYGDSYVGPYVVEVQSGRAPRRAIVGTYDDFAPPHIQELKWKKSLPVKGHIKIREIGDGRSDLELFADGNGSPDNNTAWIRSHATFEGGVRFSAAVVLGPEVHNRAEIELRDHNDPDAQAGNWIRISFVRQQNNGRLYASVAAKGYQQLHNSGRPVHNRGAIGQNRDSLIPWPAERRLVLPIAGGDSGRSRTVRSS